MLGESDSREMFLACTVGIPVIRVVPSNILAGVWRGSERIVGYSSIRAESRACLSQKEPSVELSRG